MPNKLERFTEPARRVLSLAQEEAERFHHNAIGTEHLLIGLVREGEGIAHHLLTDLKVDYWELSNLVSELSQMGQRTADQVLDLSADTKHVLERAVLEARRMNHGYIGTEHLLLGLIQQPDTITTTILSRLNIKPEDIRQGVTRLLEPESQSSLRPVTTLLASRMRTYVSGAMRGALPFTPPGNIEVLKILQLIEDGKITAEQGENLLKALPPTSATLPQTGRAQRAADPKNDPRQIRIVLNDERTQTVHLDFTLPVKNVQEGLMSLLAAIEGGLSHHTLHFSSTDYQYRIDVFMDDRHEQSGAEAS